jgi:flagellar hook-basal body complex protein FliE
MDIKASLASRLYSTAVSAAQPIPTDAARTTPREAFTTAAADFFQTMREGEEVAKAGLAGRADTQAVVEALAQTELAVQTAVAVRDRVVEAYQEILRMPV